jgi:hypothetical protein
MPIDMLYKTSHIVCSDLRVRLAALARKDHVPNVHPAS